MKYILGFIAMFIVLNGYADPCVYTNKIVQSNNDTFNRLQQENLERAALLCQKYHIDRINKADEYLDKDKRENRIIP